MIQIGPIILPPAPTSTTGSPAAIQQATANWCRQAEQAIRQLLGYINALNASSGGSGGGLPVGGTIGQVLEKNSSTNGDASWYATHYPPAGGSTNFVLTKNSGTDYDFSWTASPAGLIAGGTTGQALVKNSSTNYDVIWAAIAGLTTGGTVGQFLVKNSSTNFDASWQTEYTVPTGGTAGQALVKNSSTNGDTSFSSDPTVRSVVLCSGTTPQVTGGDVGEIEVPFAADGVTSITWNVKRIFFRVGTASGAPAVTVEKSTGTGAFSAAAVGTVTLASAANEGSVTASLGTVASGNKLRFNVGTLTSALNWTIIVELAR
jgi:hypothetical protein